MNNLLFQITHKSAKSRARLGFLKTASGTVVTPAFVPVATKGTLKGVPPALIKDTKAQIAFVNTYHLIVSPGVDVIRKFGGIRGFAKLDMPLMSDSGGFQVFSLAKKNGNRTAKIRNETDENGMLVLKINQDGVIFRSLDNGEKILFTPEKSMEYQFAIGADLIMAFDECTFHQADYKYVKKSMERTHDWLKRCVTTMENVAKPRKQFLYGIIQGGIYPDLRVASAKFVADQNVDGIAIGGVSVGESKKEMRDEVFWIKDYLSEDRPVHLLGIGQVDDIIDLVRYGIDTFDCVEPTRFAREGRLYRISQINFGDLIDNKFSLSDLFIDIKNNKFKNDPSPASGECACYTCLNFSKSYLHHLLTQREVSFVYLATIHNLYSMESFFTFLREAVSRDLI